MQDARAWDLERWCRYVSLIGRIVCDRAHLAGGLESALVIADVETEV